MVLMKKALSALIIILNSFLVTILIISFVLPNSLIIEEKEKKELEQEDTEVISEEINSLIISNKEIITYYVKEIEAEDEEIFEKEIKRQLTSNEYLIEYFLNIELTEKTIDELSKSLTDIYYQETPTTTTSTLETNEYLDYLNIATKTYNIITGNNIKIVISILILILIILLYKLKKSISQVLSPLSTVFVLIAIYLSVFISATETIYQVLPMSLKSNIFYDSNYFLVAVAICIVFALISAITYNAYQKKLERVKTYFK